MAGCLQEKVVLVTGAGRGIRRKVTPPSVCLAFKNRRSPLDRSAEVFCWDPV